VLEGILPEVDLGMVMTVNPGFETEHFLRGALAKIEPVGHMIEPLRARSELGADGGVDEETAPGAAGADVLVAGSSIFGHSPGGSRGHESVAY
jgi:ribulose-phosphate 3-epimerase